MFSNGSGFDEQPSNPGYVNTNGNPFLSAEHQQLSPLQRTSPQTVVVVSKRDTFIWSPFDKGCRSQTSPRSPPGVYGDLTRTNGLKTSYEASIHNATSKPACPYVPDQFDLSPAFAVEDLLGAHCTNSLHIYPTHGEMNHQASPPSHLADRRERLSTIKTGDSVSKPETEPGLRSTELAVTRALFTRSEGTVVALQARLKHLEAGSLPRREPRNPRGHLAAAASVQKMLRTHPKTMCGHTRRRTQLELLLEAAVAYGYLGVPNVSVVRGMLLGEGSARGSGCNWMSSDGEEKDEEKMWVRTWCAGVQKRRLVRIQAKIAKGKAVALA